MPDQQDVNKSACLRSFWGFAHMCSLSVWSVVCIAEHHCSKAQPMCHARFAGGLATSPDSQVISFKNRIWRTASSASSWGRRSSSRSTKELRALAWAWLPASWVSRRFLRRCKAILLLCLALACFHPAWLALGIWERVVCRIKWSRANFTKLIVRISLMHCSDVTVQIRDPYLLSRSWQNLQIFALLDVGEQIADENPALLERLPQQLLSMRKRVLLDFVNECRATFAAFCISLSQDLQRHTGENLEVISLARLPGNPEQAGGFDLACGTR